MRFEVKFNPSNQKIPVEFSHFQPVTLAPDVDFYEGSYEVIPKTSEQTLETKDKILTENIQICEIPYYDVANTAGGSTVYIGKEVEIYGNQ